MRRRAYRRAMLVMLMLPNRTAFRESSLVFINKPKPRWVNHKSCVWAAPTLLKQVIKLKVVYGDCKKLFCDFLGVKVAGTKHFVDELCSISDEDDQAVSRFQELFSWFQYYKHDLDDKQIQRIKSASIFPVLDKEDDSLDVFCFSFRSVDDGDWYIPDRATLESAFRGKVDILSLPVKSVMMLRDIFEKLGCEDMFLSSAIEETVEPRGTSIRDKAREVDLKTRLKYISQ